MATLGGDGWVSWSEMSGYVGGRGGYVGGRGG